MQGKIALVTGAARGIGRAVAVGLAEDGFHVVLNYWSSEQAGQGALDALRASGGSGELSPFNVADVVACEEAVEGLLESHGRLDVVVNNAGVTRDTLMVFMQPEHWTDVLSTNLGGFFNVTRPAVRAMAMQRWGRVVTISSTAGQTGSKGQVNYSASKAGLIGASRSLALEVASRGVTVNVVAPGFIDTAMIEALDHAQLKARIPVGRLGTPEDVAAAVRFLCSESAEYITGAVLSVNGGVFT